MYLFLYKYLKFNKNYKYILFITTIKRLNQQLKLGLKLELNS